YLHSDIVRDTGECRIKSRSTRNLDRRRGLRKLRQNALAVSACADTRHQPEAVVHHQLRPRRRRTCKTETAFLRMDRQIGDRMLEVQAAFDVPHRKRLVIQLAGLGLPQSFAYRDRQLPLSWRDPVLAPRALSQLRR